MVLAASASGKLITVLDSRYTDDLPTDQRDSIRDD